MRACLAALFSVNKQKAVSVDYGNRFPPASLFDFKFNRYLATVVMHSTNNYFLIGNIMQMNEISTSTYCSVTSNFSLSIAPTSFIFCT